MTDIILHHYDTSPYSEKVRLGFGLKGLAWASVELPQIMPKPNLTALTGGYRKTPVLQIGADIYCDSQLIMRELERQYPTPSFYPAWYLRQNFGPAAPPLDGFPRLQTWAERIAAIGHGSRSQMSAQQALDVARDATSIATATVDSQDPNGRKPGQTVTVTPDDTGRDPVVGELVASDVHEIVIRRSDREIGEVCVHFPRAGFVVAPA